jgi:hypothetical protein
MSQDPMIVIAEMARATKPSQGMANDVCDLNSSTGSSRSEMKGRRRVLLLKSSVLGEVNSVVEVANWLTTPMFGKFWQTKKNLGIKIDVNE